MYEHFEQLLKEYGVTTYQVAKATGISTASFSGWKNGKWNFKQEKLKKIADYFGVPLSYLLSGSKTEEIKERADELTPRDSRDIAKDLDRIMEEIANDKDGPLFYNGQPLDDEDIIFLSKAIEVALTDAKKKNKATYNPQKNKPKA